MKVYWFGISDCGLLSSSAFLDPSPSYERVKQLSPRGFNDNFALCPALKDTFHNTFDLTLPFEYSLTGFRDFKEIKTLAQTQSFFEEMVHLRDSEKRLMNLNFHYNFFCEEPCMIDYGQARMTDNNFVNNTMMLPGRFDISKWSRPLNCSFLIKKDVNDLNWKMYDVYSQIRFLTKEKIEFIKFYPSRDINEILSDYMQIRHNKGRKVWQLQKYYDTFKKTKIKKYLMKKIKENILEE